MSSIAARKRARARDRAAAERADEFEAVSDELLAKLGAVATGLEFASKVDAETSLVLLGGHELLNELGLAIMRIVQGADARRVFRQNERSKPKMGFDHALCARVYWIERARDLEAPVSTAIARARRAAGLKLSDARIQRLARELREKAFEEIEADIRRGFGRGSLLTGAQVAALRAFLQQKSKGQGAAKR